MTADTFPLARLLRKLERDCQLSKAELDAVKALPFSLRKYPGNTDIVREGDQPSQSCYVVEGFLSRFKFIREGSRQIMAFHFAGDLPDLPSIHLGRADHNLGTLTPSLVAFIPHADLRELTAEYPRVTACLWRETLIDAAIFREWIINVGRRSAEGRLAHLFCEQVMRLKQIDLADETGFPWFLTQSTLGDATGLSVVHVNRTLQHMRREGLIGANDKKLQIRNWDGLVAAGDFNPSYLHLR